MGLYWKYSAAWWHSPPIVNIYMEFSSPPSVCLPPPPPLYSLAAPYATLSCLFALPSPSCDGRGSRVSVVSSLQLPPPTILFAAIGSFDSSSLLIDRPVMLKSSQNHSQGLRSSQISICHSDNNGGFKDSVT